MANKPVLYGFDGSTYVRTVRMVLVDKNIDYDQIPVHVLKGEPREPEHLARHPFGKVPVMDIDGVRIRETDAICRYLDDTRPGPSPVPHTAKDRARMTEIMNLTESYGYNALLGAAGYHLFPDFLGNPDESVRDACVRDGETFLKLLMEIKASSRWLAGDAPTLADYYLAPILFYVAMTPEADHLIGVDGVSDWWGAMQQVKSYKATEPDLG
ncbi:glutathione S-transferase family protein [Halomonas binhaiensis]|uniref:glutathione transferase n=1 Tax=Halomonas binhaiensis TaxID=2562282 RepID=A0A5C1NJQ1_9GAMM|nr:glutathione S-transferase family protein [Halomonas binhaiensis]QEM82931.1 glutathione S-transferase family protein [Halomonas binhaiensis]